MSHRERLVALFDQHAEDGTAERSETLLEDVVRQALDGMVVRPGEHLLDAGCGTGWATRRLGKKAAGAQAIGVDISPAMIARAEGLSDWTSRARFERMAIENLEFPEGKFDHVFSLETLEYVEDVERALGSLARVTRAGGRLELLVHRRPDSPRTESWPDALGVPMQWLDEATWTEVVREAGFELEAASTLKETRDAAPFATTPTVPDPATRDEMLRGAGVLWLRGRRAG